MKRKGYVFSIFVFAIFASVFVIAVTNAKSVAVLQEASYDEIKVMKAGNLYRNVDMILKSGLVDSAAVKDAIESEELPFNVTLEPSLSVASKDCKVIYGFVPPDCGGIYHKSCDIFGHCVDVAGPGTDTCTDATSCAVTCPDGDIDPGEECDGANIGTYTCAGLGFGGGGVPTCDANCKISTAGCISTGCNVNGDLGPGEECDPGPPASFGGKTCKDIDPSYTGGSLSCTPDCTIDDSACTTGCNHDGVKDTGEECDINDFGTETCLTRGYGAGTLTCDSTCKIDTSSCAYACTGTPPKANKVLEPGEQCDTNKLNGETCLSQGYLSGKLKCTKNCNFDYSGCKTKLASYWTTPANKATCISGYAISDYDCGGNCDNKTSRAYCTQLPSGVTWQGSSYWTTGSYLPSCLNGYVAAGFDCIGDCDAKNMKLFCVKLKSGRIGSSSWTSTTAGQHSCSSKYARKFSCTNKDCSDDTMRVYCSKVSK